MGEKDFEKIKEVIEGKCPKCKSDTTFYYIGVQTNSKQTPIGLSYNCKKCDATSFLTSLQKFNDNNLLNEIKLCMWKDTANKDKTKKEKNPDAFDITFGPRSPCHKCDGYDIKCSKYDKMID